MLRADPCLSQSLIDATRELVVAADLQVIGAEQVEQALSQR